MKIAAFPPMIKSPQNLYLYHLRKSLEAIGIQVEYNNPGFLFASWLIKNRKKIDILHFHWLQYHYINLKKRRLSFRLLFRFLCNLVLAKILRYKIIWTMHNAVPHENVYPKISWVVYKFFSLISYSIVTHCEYAKKILADNFNRKKAVIMSPHPNFINVYPQMMKMAEARNRLNIPKNILLFLYFGEIRSYKGLDTLITTYYSYKNDNSRLLIRGKPFAFDPSIHGFMEKLAKQDRRILADFTYIPNDEIQVYLRAADVVVFPFTRITMSGSVILAMSFGKPVIVPAIGGITEFVNENLGIIYDPIDPEGLLKALQQCETAPLSVMGAQSFKAVSSYTWENLSADTKKAYTIKEG